MQDLVFDAQSALLLDEPRSAERLVMRAERELRGELARGLRRDAPAAGRAVREALADARRSARARDEIALAAARGRLRAALMRGSLRGDGGRGRAPATPTARAPGCCCASSARPPASPAPVWTERWPCASWRVGTAAPARPLLGVRKDLLDAYQASLTDHLGEAEDAAERGFRARWAQTAAVAAGLWQILAPEYEKARGERRASARRRRVRRAAAHRAARRPGRLRGGAGAGRRRPRRLHRRPLHRRRAGAPRRAADPLRRADPGRLRPRHRRRQGHDPVRDPGVDRVQRGLDLRVLRPRGGPDEARPARHGDRGAHARPAARVRRGRARRQARGRPRTRSRAPRSAPAT